MPSRSAQRLWRMLSLVSVIVLGLGALTREWLADASDTGFAYRVQDSGEDCEIVLEQAAGSPRCWIALQLQLDDHGSALREARARLGALGLAAELEQLHGANWELRLCERSDEAHATPNFEWPAGQEIVVSLVGVPRAACRVTDWTVHLGDGPADSRSRRIQTRLVFCLLLLASAGGSLAVWKLAPSEADARPEPPAESMLLTGLIARVEGKDAQTSALYQRMLRKFFEDGLAPREVIESTCGGWSARNAQHWLHASRLFRAQAQHLRKNLDRWLERLTREAG